MSLRFEFWNEDALTAAIQRIRPGSVDLIFTDPPFGLDDPEQVYNRDEGFVVDGYVEVPTEEYPRFTDRWIYAACRALRPGGSLVVCSGYTNLSIILRILGASQLEEVNHIIWKFNFGVHTKQKFVSSHYHLLYWTKPGGKRTFNRFCRFSEDHRTANGGSSLYRDMEDVWIINREYQPGKVKNKNMLPSALVEKVLLYCSDPGELVCDFFLGSFAVAKVAKSLGRSCIGFELNSNAFVLGEQAVEATTEGSMVKPAPVVVTPMKRGAPWTAADLTRLKKVYSQLRGAGKTKKDTVTDLCQHFGRGRFGIEKALKKAGVK